MHCAGPASLRLTASASSILYQHARPCWIGTLLYLCFIVTMCPTIQSGWFPMNVKFGIASGFVLLLVSSLCLSQAPAKKEELATHLQKAQGYLREKRPDLAIPEVQAAASIDPDNVETQG